VEFLATKLLDKKNNLRGIVFNHILRVNYRTTIILRVYFDEFEICKEFKILASSNVLIELSSYIIFL
jgi:hypothetical protein